LVSSVFRDGVGLSLVLVHSAVDILNDIRSNGSSENSGKRSVGFGGFGIRVDSD
jgi:hypothetical protein